ncbi:D-aminoacyl-tRNA deacylase isoform X3 [Glycine soja]|uniref:D-aminoacyl-tRNA deacylase n=1 Tax=Glycine max TaxID=3847 RepID=A0A0R0G6Q2_SOYBN|nr:D-aminoacyl-tRNA deacylase isoform X3 [Glycine max]XP_006597473.1 D-aminoacyl-tRNA deacylase isoform X3 [Glycine max]XP_028202551.1 D-aminoacyl-tRNA deacylase isoform X3 [Glycine soja]XP_028202552.1 D-aminoacyl-tRNA deacylase isoform X3 [Glycine soja]XP_028202553.1 D-aminoacyl-tRNA deacylase isoform X3 [Glycine soja]|eukprot:XP_006597472.1 D-aminoacyl-tRNA deacylase isoform X3 [Glycine max]
MQLQLVSPCRVPRVGGAVVVGGIHRIGTLTSTVTVRRRSKAVTTAMRAVVQRVASASVEVEGRIVSEIGPGLLVLVGIHDSDSDADADYICRKVLNMRLFPNENTGKAWDHSVMQKNYQVLLVSQFTLYGFLKGNKPDFHVAMAPQRAKPFYASLVDRFRNAYNSDAIKAPFNFLCRRCIWSNDEGKFG